MALDHSKKKSCPQETILGRPDERAGLSHDLNVTARGRLVVVVHGTSSDRWCQVATAQERDARGVDVVTFCFSRGLDVDTVVMHTELLVLRGATVDVCWQVVGCGIGITRKRGPDLAGHWNIPDEFQARLAAAVCLAASRVSVRSQTHSSGCDIEAVLLALSETGPKVSMVNHILRLPKHPKLPQRTCWTVRAQWARDSKTQDVDAG